MLDTELAYAAGLFDGEGTVTAVPFSKHRGSYMLCTRLGMVDEGPIRWLSNNFNGSIIKRVYACHKYRPLYVWSAHAKNMCNFIKLVSPYMKIKKHQCELAMEMYSTFNKESHRSLKVPENVKSRRFEIYNLIKSMHSRKGNSYAYKTIE